MKVNLGPVGLADSVPGPEGGLGYNPRCLKRDVGPAQTQRYCNAGTILRKLSNSISQLTDVLT
jgi:tyrosinase